MSKGWEISRLSLHPFFLSFYNFGGIIVSGDGDDGNNGNNGDNGDNGDNGGVIIRHSIGCHFSTTENVREGTIQTLKRTCIESRCMKFYWEGHSQNPWSCHMETWPLDIMFGRK